MSSRWLLCLSMIGAITLPSCQERADDDDVSDDDVADDDDVVDDDDTDDDDTADIPPVCSDGTWGTIQHWQTAVHVRVDGSDANDGSAAAPVATLDAALEIVRGRETDKYIAVGPGTFDAQLRIREDVEAGASDTGLWLQGCGPDETVLQVPELDSGIQVTEATDVTLRGFTMEGGFRGLWIWGGAQVTVQFVDIIHSALVGVIIGGWDTIVALEDVNVVDPVVADVLGVEYGYGISIQDVGLFGGDGAATLSNVQVTGSQTVGVLVHASDATLASVSVADTQPAADGAYGRGIQIQELSVAALDGATLAGNHDAGLFSIGSFSLVVQDVVVDGTLAATLPDSQESSGDGIVFALGDAGYDPATLLHRMTDCTVTSSVRAGIVVDGVHAELTGNVAGGDNGYSEEGISIIAQEQAVVTGDDHVEPDTPLDLNIEAIAVPSGAP